MHFIKLPKTTVWLLVRESGKCITLENPVKKQFVIYFLFYITKCQCLPYIIFTYNDSSTRYFVNVDLQHYDMNPILNRSRTCPQAIQHLIFS